MELLYYLHSLFYYLYISVWMMFARADETAGDIPVKDITVNPYGAATLSGQY